MQPPSHSEDIHTILGRFHTWAGKNPGNGNGKTVAEAEGALREIAYEEAMRNFRRRHKTSARRASAAAEPPVQEAPPVPAESVLVSSKEQMSPTPAPVPAPETASAAPPVVQSLDLTPAPPAAAAKAIAPSPRRNKPSQTKGRRPSKTADDPPVIRALVPAAPSQLAPQPKALSKPKARRATPAKKSTALAVRPLAAPACPPAFKKVLAKSVRNAPAPAKSTQKTGPDRTHRITTRFSAAEQRRLERAAAEVGLTVSAWLRQCALRAETASAPPASAPAPSRRKKAAAPVQLPEPTLFSTPAPSGLGSWLTLLRQRFLSSPARLSERA